MPGLRPSLVRRMAGCFLLAALAAPALPRSEPAGHGPPERKRQALLDAYQNGMPLDSLYYLLAGDALRRLSFDTAMAFNLSIPTPAGGSFRDSMLVQRHRLYILSGLREDASRLEDSLPRMPKPAPIRRPVTWELRTGSGYSGERQGPARSYPSGREVAGIDTVGWLARSRGKVGIPIPSPAGLPLGIGLGYDIAKSYYKDSLDYRASMEFRADKILKWFSAGMTLEAGRITALGPVAALKADLSWSALDIGGFWLGYAGYESEWERFREKRYDAAWLALLRVWDLGSGRSFQGSLSGSLLLMDPFQLPGMGNVIFVDDVSKSRPVHYRAADFLESIPSNSIATLENYRKATDSLSFPGPQGVFSMNPSISFTTPVAGGLKAEIGMGYGFAYYPDEYSWKEDQGSLPFPGSSKDFRGYALNRADGRYYHAYLVQVNGGFDEIYSPEPLRERRVRRKDHHLDADFALIQSLSRWGEVRMDLGTERTFSTLADEAPVWIPEWDYSASLRWSMSGRWFE